MMLNGCINKPFKGVIFDKDGTLLEVEQFWHAVYQYAISNFLNIDQAHIKIIYHKLGITDRGLERDSLASMGSVKEIWLTLKDAVSEPIHSLDTFEEYVKKGVLLNISLVSLLSPIVPELLDTLKEQGVYLALITTDSRDNTEYMLKTFGIFNQFDYIGCGDDLLSPKPAVDHGLAFIDKFQLLTHEMQMVGDSIYDALFAERLNMPFSEIRNPDDLEKMEILEKKQKERKHICVQ